MNKKQYEIELYNTRASLKIYKLIQVNDLLSYAGVSTNTLMNLA